jgi:hypothetical protein
MATVWIVERGPDVDPLEVLSVHHSHAGALNAAVADGACGHWEDINDEGDYEDGGQHHLVSYTSPDTTTGPRWYVSDYPVQP